MIDVSTANDGHGLEAAVRMLRKSRHDVAVVHPPAIASFEILADGATGEQRSRAKALIAFRIVVDVMNAE
jgi:hypothetical protein